MDIHAKIFVAGHMGMVGSALVRLLKQEGYHNLVLKTHAELDLCSQQMTAEFFDKEKLAYVFMAAAKVGGILANKQNKAHFFYDNIMMETNVIHHAHKSGVKKLLFLGSSCIYPKEAALPIQEESFMTGKLEKTNDTYSLSKIS